MQWYGYSNIIIELFWLPQRLSHWPWNQNFQANCGKGTAQNYSYHKYPPYLTLINQNGTTVVLDRRAFAPVLTWSTWRGDGRLFIIPTVIIIGFYLYTHPSTLEFKSPTIQSEAAAVHHGLFGNYSDFGTYYGWDMATHWVDGRCSWLVGDNVQCCLHNKSTSRHCIWNRLVAFGDHQFQSVLHWK